MATSDEAEMKQAGSNVSSAIGPMKNETPDAFKTAGLPVKNPNPKVAEMLAEQIEAPISSANDLQSVLKDVKPVAK